MLSYPPFLEEVLEHNAKSALLYIKLWRARGESGKVICNKKDVTKLLLFSWKKFRSDLRHLERQRILHHKINRENDKAIIQFEDFYNVSL